MTEPGWVEPASTGWWVRTNRVGLASSVYGWTTTVAGFAPITLTFPIASATAEAIDPGIAVTPIANSAAGSTVAIPPHAIGNIIVIFAYRDGSNVIPGKPSASGTIPTWLDIDANTGSSTNSMRTASAIATADDHTSGTWTNANYMVAVVLGGATNYVIGNHAESGGVRTTGAIAPAITMARTSGVSTLLHGFGRRDGNWTSWSAAPTGYMTKTSVGTGAAGICLDTKNVPTSDGSVTQETNGSSSVGYRGATVEVFSLLSTDLVYLDTGAGTTSGTSPATYTHVLSADADALLVGVSVSHPGTVTAVSCGGTAMTSLSSHKQGASGTTVYVYGLLAPPTGSRTISVTHSGAVAVNSVSYKNVSSFGTPVTNGDTTATASVTPTTAAEGDRIFNIISTNASSLQPYTNYNQTLRYSVEGSASNFSTVIGDAYGASSVVFSATQPESLAVPWSAIAVPIEP